MSKQELIDIPIFWDFDLTVSKEFQQIPLFEKRFTEIKKHLITLGFKPKNASDYFEKVDKSGGDKGLTYLQHMIWDAKKGGCLEGLTDKELFMMGKLVQPADGFKKCLYTLQKEFAKKARIRHFFISVGIKKMIEGFLTKQRMKTYIQEIAASEFFVDENGVINGIKKAVSPFGKNEWIISFMKGSFSLLNKQLSPKQYKYNYQNMIVIGDGFTDIAKFAYAKKKGGTPIAVYKPHCEKSYTKACSTVGSWADYILPQEYGPHTQTYKFLREAILEKISAKPKLRPSLLHDYKKGLVTDKTEKNYIKSILQKDTVSQNFFRQVRIDSNQNIHIKNLQPK